jgi:uncharacterized protein YbjT (DUF2867 family)
VPRLRAAGHDVRVLSRHHHDGPAFVTGDLDTGEGVDAAVQGTDIIVHLAGTTTGDDVKARHLVEAAMRAGTRHLVYISVVGADRVPQNGRLDRALFGYFGSKLAAEHVVAGSGLPWTMLRATQFHELTLATVRQMAKLSIVPVPSGFRFQPVDAGEVADRLVELAQATPAGLVPDLAGPEVFAMADLVRGYLAAHGRHRPILPVRLPGRAARAFRAGANLPQHGILGHRTWEEFLAGTAPVPA